MEVSFQDWFSKQVGRRFKLKVESSAGACRLLIQGQVFLRSESSEQTLRQITHVSICKYSGQKLLSPPKFYNPYFFPVFFISEKFVVIIIVIIFIYVLVEYWVLGGGRWFFGAFLARIFTDTWWFHAVCIWFNWADESQRNKLPKKT